MISFKEMVASDRDNVFLNMEEFGETHEIDYKTVNCIWAPDSNEPLPSGESYGVTQNISTLYTKLEDLPQRKESGQMLNIDGREMTIISWGEDMGMAVIKLEQTVNY